MHALGCLIFLFIIGFVLIIALVRGVLSFLFGGFSRRGGDNYNRRRTKSRTDSTNHDGNNTDYYKRYDYDGCTVYIHHDAEPTTHFHYSTQSDSQSHSQSNSQSGSEPNSWSYVKQSKGKSDDNNKVIGEDEGEYVDYEEVK